MLQLTTGLEDICGLNGKLLTVIVLRGLYNCNSFTQIRAMIFSATLRLLVSSIFAIN